MTHPDTLTIPRAVVEPEWGPEQAYAEGRSAYENSMLPNTTSAVRFNELSSSEQAFWVAHAAFRAALQPQAAVTTSGPPERDNSKPAEQQGVFRKFNVQRTDGSDQPGGKHHGCEYFVLDVAHDQHAKQALEAYAVACATTHPQLSADMRERYGLQPQAAAPAKDDDGLCFDDSEHLAAQAAAEPVAWTNASWLSNPHAGHYSAKKTNCFNVPLYTTPPATQAENPMLKDYVEKAVAAERRKWQAALTEALEKFNEIVSMEGTESNEWDGVERVIPEICAVAKAAIAQLEALGVKHD